MWLLNRLIQNIQRGAMQNLSNPWDVLWYICSFLAKPWFFNLCGTREKSRRNSFHNIIFDICSGNILFLLPQSCTWSSMKDYMLDQFMLWRLLILLLRRLTQKNIIHRIPCFLFVSLRDFVFQETTSGWWFLTFNV